MFEELYIYVYLFVNVLHGKLNSVNDRYTCSTLWLRASSDNIDLVRMSRLNGSVFATRLPAVGRENVFVSVH